MKMEKRALQAILGVLSLVPLIGLAIGFTAGTSYFQTKGGGALPVDLDNQFRYLCGVYTIVTFGIWYSLPRIEESTPTVVLRLIGAGIFVGAIGRIISMVHHGMPNDKAMIAGVVLEAVIVPLLLLWHARIIRLANTSQTPD